MNPLVIASFIFCVSGASIPVPTPPTPISASAPAAVPNNTTQLPTDVVEAVNQQVLMDFKQYHEISINGMRVKLPQERVDVETLHNILQQQSARQNALLGTQKTIMIAQSQQEALNRKMRSGQYTEEFLLDYAEGSSEQTQKVVSEVTSTMKPYTSMLKHSIGNFLLSPFLNSVTEGSKLYSNALGRMKQNSDPDTRSTAHNMTSRYTDLAQLGMDASLDYNGLQSNTENIIKILKL